MVLWEAKLNFFKVGVKSDQELIKKVGTGHKSLADYLDWLQILALQEQCHHGDVLIQAWFKNWMPTLMLYILSADCARMS